MVKLKCQRKTCQNIWNYKGKNKFYAPCSRCKTSVTIRKATVKRDG